jgi:cardiolipin synthase
MRSLSFIGNNALQLLHSGGDFFPALIAAFDAAVSEIFLETYIFALDDTGTVIRDALHRAAGRGVVVYVMTDWLGTGRVGSNSLAAGFAQAGVHFRSFNPWFSRGVARTHRKLCVVDRRIAFVGGLNINDDMRDDSHPQIVLPAPRWDFAVQIDGPLAAVIHLELDTQWVRLGKLGLRARWQRFKNVRATFATVSQAPALAALVMRDNLRNRRTIQRAYLQALGQARTSVLVANPYFAPGRKLRKALELAAARGVEVTLLLGVGQFRMQDAVAHSYYPKLLKHGVKIVEYEKTQLHAKVAVVDDDWATVGSSNYDGLSLFVNQEANIVIRDAVFAQALRARIEEGIAQGVPVIEAEFANKPWYKRLWYGAAFMLYVGVLRAITLGKYA